MNKGDALAKLRREYVDLGVQKKVVRAQVKADFEVKIQMEIQRRVAEAEAEFARHLAAEKERHDLTVSSIQDEVLRTRTWTRWEKWRDMADIEPERVSIQFSREKRRDDEKPYRIEDGVVIVTRNAEGPVEEFRIENVAGNEKVGYAFWPYFDGEDYDRMMTAFPEGIAAVSPFLKEAFAKYGDDMRDLVAEREEA